jgi:CheY-like chemotaxis protein
MWTGYALYKKQCCFAMDLRSLGGAYMYASSGEQPHVLLIESDLCLRRLIAISLQSQGLQVSEMAQMSRALPLPGKHQPDLIVVDVDGGVHRNWNLLRTVQELPDLRQTPTIVLCWEQEESTLSALLAAPPTCQETPQPIYMTKPFDARLLHQAVARILHEQEAQKVAQEAQAEEILLAAYTRHSAPSLMPMLTAAGLLLAVIGLLLLQVALSVVGFLIVIVALLYWTLGGQKVSPQIASA